MHAIYVFLAVLAVATRAHMSLWYPPPLGGSLQANPLTTQVDNELNFPIGCCDSEGRQTLPSPGDCRGHLNLLDTEEGRPQVTWEPGQDAYFQLSDHTYTADAPGSTHYGGSCQIGFSVDRGQTWKVAASYHGNCPHRQENDPQVFHFKIPLNMPSGPAVFAWVWLNREHESFMNCASVQIGAGSGRNTTHMNPSSKAGSLMYHTALPTPAGEVSTERERHRSGDCDQNLTNLPPYAANIPVGRTQPMRYCVRSGYRLSVHSHWLGSAHWDVRCVGREVSRNISGDASVTGSWWNRTKHRHSRKHARYYYYVRKTHTHPSSPEHRRGPDSLASDACDWNAAPRMETSYYSTGASCAPDAKLNDAQSDDFEIGWSDACGIVEGDGEYTIHNIEC